jgi:hypothetical protein
MVVICIHAKELSRPSKPRQNPSNQKGDMTAELPEPANPRRLGPARERTVRWHDPGPTTAVGLSMAGVDYLNAMIDGTLPPPPIAGLT